jgi:NAD(P)-dependent dehydrogenase (short-subunit alcohol dehydrogenase family)
VTAAAPTSRPVALVTGGSGGIGAAICARLARDEYDVAFTYRANREAAEATYAAVAAAGTRAAMQQLDVTDADAAARLVAAVVAELGRLDAVVIAAGPYIDMLLTNRVDPARLRAQLDADVLGCANVVTPALAALRERRGSVTALVTPAIRRATARDMLSAVPKAAVESMIKHLAVEEGRYGVRANCVGVGLIRDGMYDRLVADGYFDERWLAAAERNLALRRLGSATDVANAVAFLASDQASWITGQTLMVDGGYAI